MNKREALELAIELWTFLAATGARKEQWAHYNAVMGMVSSCPLCELYAYSSKCEGCPLADVDEEYADEAECAAGRYRMWRIAEDIERRKEIAASILQTMTDAYNELEVSK